MDLHPGGHSITALLVSTPAESELEETNFTSLLNDDPPFDYLSRFTDVASSPRASNRVNEQKDMKQGSVSEKGVFNPVDFLSDAANDAIAIVYGTKRGDLKRLIETLFVEDPPPPARKRRKTEPHSDIPGCSLLCFDAIQPDEAMRRGRSGYLDPESREKIAYVRNKGACYRCQVQKKECSKTRPCQRCVEAAEFSNQSESLRWMHCFVLKLLDANVFAAGLLFNAHSFDFFKKSSISNREILSQGATNQPIVNIWRPSTVLGLDQCFKLFGECIVDSTSDPRQWPTGELNSCVIRADLAAYFGADFTEQYHHLLSAYTSTKFEKKFEMNYRDLNSFLEAKHRYDNIEMSRSGTRVLAALQQRLQPLRLETCSADFKRVLFLVLIGTIFAAGRVRREACGTHQGKDMVNCGYDYLILTLSTTVIHLGKRLNLFQGPTAEKNLIDNVVKFAADPCSFVHLPVSELNKPFMINLSRLSSKHLRVFVCEKCLATRWLLVCDDTLVSPAKQMVDIDISTSGNKSLKNVDSSTTESVLSTGLAPSVQSSVREPSTLDGSPSDTLYGNTSFAPPGGGGGGGRWGRWQGRRVPRDPFGF